MKTPIIYSPQLTPANHPAHITHARFFSSNAMLKIC